MTCLQKTYQPNLEVAETVQDAAGDSAPAASFSPMPEVRSFNCVHAELDEALRTCLPKDKARQGGRQDC